MSESAFRNPFQAGEFRFLRQQGATAGRPAATDAAAAPAAPASVGVHVERAPVDAPSAVAARITPFVPYVAPRSGPAMKLLEGAMADPGGEATVRGVLVGPPSQVALAMTFAALVDDPASRPDRFPSVLAQRRERARLLDLMAALARTGARRDTVLLSAARAEIRQSCLRPLPPDTRDDEVLFREAQGFTELEAVGGDAAIETLFAERFEEYGRTGRWRGTLLELRACLWYYWLWEERLATSGPVGDREAVRHLYRQVRQQWGELAEEVERALEPFRGPRVSAPGLRRSAVMAALDD